MQCLVSFELVFPPSFFNIMTHVLVHLVDEIVIMGPVFLHNMYPFERFMGVVGVKTDGSRVGGPELCV